MTRSSKERQSHTTAIFCEWSKEPRYLALLIFVCMNVYDSWGWWVCSLFELKSWIEPDCLCRNLSRYLALLPSRFWDGGWDVAWRFNVFHFLFQAKLFAASVLFQSATKSIMCWVLFHHGIIYRSTPSPALAFVDRSLLRHFQSDWLQIWFNAVSEDL